MVLSEEIAIKDGGKYGRWDNVTNIILITRNLHDRVRIFFKKLERSKTLSIIPHKKVILIGKH